MKKLVLFLTLWLTISIPAFSQDYIIMHNGQEIKARIIDFHQNTISYRSFDDLSGEIFIIEKEKVLMIKYQDGSTVVIDYNQKVDTSEIQNAYIDTNLNDLAIRDARQNYKDMSPAIAAGCCMASCSPVGLPMAVYMASQPPKIENMNIPPDKKNNSKYINYYQEEAHNLKRKRILYGTLIAVPINMLIVLSFLNSL